MNLDSTLFFLVLRVRVKNCPAGGSPLSHIMTGSDVFLDGSLPFVNVAQVRGSSPISATPNNTATSVSVGGSVTSQTFSSSDVTAGLGVPTLTITTHTVSRPVDSSGSMSSVPGTSMTLSQASHRPPLSYCGYFLPPGTPTNWSRPTMPQTFYPGFNQYPFTGFWPGANPPGLPTPIIQSSSGSENLPSPVVSVPAVASISIASQPTIPSNPGRDVGVLDSVKNLFDDLKKSVKNDLKGLADRISQLESKDAVPPPSPDRSSGEEGDFADHLSVAPGSHEGDFLSEEELLPSRNIATNSGPPSVSSEANESISLKDLRDKTL